MPNPIRICFAGIGGVGGFFGGMMARYYHAHPDVRIQFLCKGEHRQAILRNGLLVQHGDTEFIAHPDQVEEHPSSLNAPDILIVCTKGYDLESLLLQFKNYLKPNTWILPLLNGVNHREHIEQILPGHRVLDGCVYLVSRKVEAGVIQNQGTIQKLFFGKTGLDLHPELQKLEFLLQQAGCEALYPSNIQSIIWEKFIFLSPVVSVTSYFDSVIGDIRKDASRIKLLEKLMKEVIQLSEAKAIIQLNDILQKSLQKVEAMSATTTSSMHSDFLSGKKITELHFLTEYVISESKKYGLHTPGYEMVLKGIQERWGVYS